MTLQAARQHQRRATSLREAGRLDEAADAARQALETAERVRGAPSPDIANLLGDLAEIEAEREQLHDALALALRAQTVLDSLGTAFAGVAAARVRIRTWTLIGSLRRQLGEPDNNSQELRAALALARATFDEQHDETTAARNNLAVDCKYAGRFEEALILYRRSLRALEHAPAKADALSVGALLHNIGGLYHAMGRFDEAEEPARRAWEISRRKAGDEAVRTQQDSVAYAAVLDALGRHAEALHRYAVARDVFKRELGADHTELAHLNHNMAATLASQGRLAQAQRSYREALACHERTSGPDGLPAALSRIGLGGVLVQLARYDEACSVLLAAHKALEGRIEPEHPHWWVLERHLSAARKGQGAG